MKCVIGLGNPGQKYTLTRHNVGYMVVSELAKELSLEFSQAGFSDVAKGWLRTGSGSKEVLLVKPGTYMNESGKAVEELLTDFPIQINEFLVVHDDMDIPFGRLRIRRRGSSGGHRGVESIIECIGSEDFPRLKVGIGRPDPGVDPVDYVLQPFQDNELRLLPKVIEVAKEAIFCVLMLGVDRAMNEYNRIEPLEETRQG